MKVVLDRVSCVRGGREVLAVDHLEIPAGRVTAILGANGAGKTTMLRTIAGLERPVRGRALLDDRPAARDRATSSTIAFVFQESVFLRRSVRDNLELGLELRGVPAGPRRERAEAVARRCGVGALMERPAHQLSGGEARRVDIARALALEAPLLLLDEPLAGLDGGARDRLLHELPGLLAGHASTTLLVTHHAGDALWLAEHLVVLEDGRVLASGEKGAIWRQPPDAATARLIGHTVVEAGSVTFAVPAGDLRSGDGTPGFDLVVAGVTTVGALEIAFGRIGEDLAQAHLTPGTAPPRPGETLRVHAPAAIAL